MFFFFLLLLKIGLSIFILKKKSFWFDFKKMVFIY